MNMVSGFMRQGSCNMFTLCSSTTGSSLSFRSLTHGLYPSKHCRSLIHGMYFSECHVTGQVIGVPHDKYGEEVCAWVRMQPGCNATAKELTVWCERRLAAFKVPKTWKLVDTYPMTASGKVQKYIMRQQHIADTNA